MMIITTERIPINIWSNEIEEGALLQAKNLANLPFAFDHIAVMPDVHQGYGMPIGGVLAAEGAVVPNAVGVDIGCGMSAVQTDLHEINKKKLKTILAEIYRLIPLGFKHHKEPQDRSLMPEISNGMPVSEREYASARHQVGTLGGGNHFIEIQKGDDGCIWIMIHSGSRNIGKQVADYYNKLAKKTGQKWDTKVPEKWQLAFLPEDSAEGRQYLREMQYCVDFAFANRKLMMERVREVFTDQFHGKVDFRGMINIAHNFAAEEIHYGKRVYIHRKGATPAETGMTGIVPGSQGSPSFIVRGLGSPESFRSCSHGAGRKMGRKEAVRTLNFAEEKRKLDSMGILHSIKKQRDLDEAMSAYKDIEEVMKNQQDLVDVETRLVPLAVMKG